MAICGLTVVGESGSVAVVVSSTLVGSPVCGSMWSSTPTVVDSSFCEFSVVVGSSMSFDAFDSFSTVVGSSVFDGTSRTPFPTDSSMSFDAFSSVILLIGLPSLSVTAITLPQASYSYFTRTVPFASAMAMTSFCAFLHNSIPYRCK